MALYPRVRIGIRLVVSGSILAILVAMSSQAVRVAEADRLKHTSNWDNLNRAALLQPLDAATARAIFDASAGSLEHETAGLAALSRAVDLNPRDAQNWIDMAFAAESAGDLTHAEQYLRRAAQMNRMYEPAWSLANFYQRRGRTTACLDWIRKAAMMTDRDLTALFDLAWHADADPNHILANAIPAQAPAMRAYLSYLISSHRIEAAGPVAEKLAAISDAASVDALLSYCDRSLGEGVSSYAAVAVWNTLVRRRLIVASLLDPSREAVTNPEFTAPRIGHGFDWIPFEVDGVSIVSLSDGWNVEFSGKQPEQCRLIEQRIPVIAGKPYIFRISYQTTTAALSPTGISWSILDTAGSRTLANGPDLTGEQKSELLVHVPPATGDLVHLVLRYTRPRGATRFEGTLMLFAARMSPEALAR